MAKRQQKIANRIRDRRSTSGLSQTDLANRLSVSQPLVSQWETGKATPDSKQLTKLQEILGGITTEEESSDQVYRLSRPGYPALFPRKI